MLEDISAPPSKNTVSTFHILWKLIFFYLGRFLKKLADDQYSSITKGSIYCINQMYIQPFTTVVDWSEIGCLMEVFTMFYICRYCILLGMTDLKTVNIKHYKCNRLKLRKHAHDFINSYQNIDITLSKNRKLCVFKSLWIQRDFHLFIIVEILQ